LKLALVWPIMTGRERAPERFLVSVAAPLISNDGKAESGLLSGIVRLHRLPLLVVVDDH
jgi:hypothetical protein